MAEDIERQLEERLDSAPSQIDDGGDLAVKIREESSYREHSDSREQEQQRVQETAGQEVSGSAPLDLVRRRLAAGGSQVEHTLEGNPLVVIRQNGEQRKFEYENGSLKSIKNFDGSTISILGERDTWVRTSADGSQITLTDAPFVDKSGNLRYWDADTGARITEYANRVDVHLERGATVSADQLQGLKDRLPPGTAIVINAGADAAAGMRGLLTKVGLLPETPGSATRDSAANEAQLQRPRAGDRVFRPSLPDLDATDLAILRNIAPTLTSDKATSEFHRRISETTANWGFVSGAYDEARFTRVQQAQLRYERDFQQRFDELAARAQEKMPPYRERSLDAKERQQMLDQLIQEEARKLPSHQEWQRLTSEFAGENARYLTEIGERTRQLQKQLDAFAREHKLPLMQLEVVRTSHDAGAYVRGKGTIRISAEDLADPKNARDVMRTLYHEMTHGEQDRLVIGSLIDEARKTSPDSSVQKTVMDLYKNRTGVELDSTFFEQVSRLYDTHGPLSDVERRRAEILTDSFKNTSAIPPEFQRVRQDAKVVDRNLIRLETNDDGAVDRFFKAITQPDGETLRKHLFPEGKAPESIDRLIKSWQAAPKDASGRAQNFDSEGARQTLMTELNGRLGDLNKRRETLWSNYMQYHEIEAYNIEAMLPGGEQSRATTRPQDSARVQGARRDAHDVLQQIALETPSGSHDDPLGHRLRRQQLQRIEAEATTRYVDDLKRNFPNEPIKQSERAQQSVYRSIDDFLREPGFGGTPSMYERGWRVHQSKKNSPADAVGIDFVLVNQKTGNYHIIDTTAQEKGGSSLVHRIQWGRGDVDSVGELTTEGRLSVHEHIRELVRKSAQLNVVQHPLPSLDRIANPEQARANVQQFREVLQASGNPSLKQYSKEIAGSEAYLGYRVKESQPEFQSAQTHFEQQGDKALRDSIRELLSGDSKFAKTQISDKHGDMFIQRDQIKLRTKEGEYKFAAGADKIDKIFNEEFSEAIKKATPRERDRLFQLKREVGGQLQDQVRERTAAKLSNEKAERLFGLPKPSQPEKPAPETTRYTPDETKALKEVAKSWRELQEAVSNKELAATFNPDVRDVLAESVRAAKDSGTLTQKELAAAKKLLDDYKPDNPEGVRKVHDYLKKSSSDATNNGSVPQAARVRDVEPESGSRRTSEAEDAAKGRQAETPSGRNSGREHKAPVAEMLLEVMPDGQVRVGNRAQLDKSKPERFEEAEQKWTKEIERAFDDRIKNEPDSERRRVLEEHKRNYVENRDGYRARFHEQVRSILKEIREHPGEATRKLGGRALAVGGAAVSFLMVFNEAAHAMGAPDANKQGPKDQPPKPVLRDSAPVHAPQSEKQEQAPKSVRDAASVEDRQRPADKPVERVEPRTYDENSRHGKAVKELQEFTVRLLPGMQGEVERQLSGADQKGLGFNSQQSADLQTALSAQLPPTGPGNLPAQLLQDLQRSAEAGLLKPEIMQVLQKQSWTDEDRQALKQGIFKPELIEQAMQREISAQTFGPVSQSMYAAAVRSVEQLSTQSMRDLARAGYRNIPDGAPLTLPDNADSRAFLRAMATADVRLDANTKELPTNRDIDKFFNALDWTNKAQDVLTEQQRKADIAVLDRAVSLTGIDGWKYKPEHGSREQWLSVVTPLINTYAQTKATAEALDTLSKHLKPEDLQGDKAWINQAIRDLEQQGLARSRYLPDGSRLFEFNFPQGLDRDHASIKKVEAYQNWLEKWKDKTSQQFGEVLRTIDTSGILMLMDRPKDVHQSGDEAKSPNGHDYNLVSHRFDVTELPDGRIRVDSQTTYHQSELYNLYDIGAREVDRAPEAPVYFERGQLVPVMQGDKVLFIKAENLKEFRDWEKTKKNWATGFEITIDLAMLATATIGIGATMKAGAVAARQAGKAGFKEMARAALKETFSQAGAKGMFELTLGASGGVLHTAKAQESAIGQLAGTARGYIFLAQAGRHVLDIGRSAVGVERTASTAAQLVRAQQYAKAGEYFQSLEGVARAGETTRAGVTAATSTGWLGWTVGMGVKGLDLSAKATFAVTTPYFAWTLGGEAIDRISGRQQAASLDTDQARANYLKVQERTGAEHFLTTGGATLAQGKSPAVAGRITETVNRSAQALALPQDHPDRLAAEKASGDEFQTRGTTAQEKMAAAMSVLLLAHKDDGTLCSEVGGIKTTDVVRYLEGELGKPTVTRQGPDGQTLQPASPENRLNASRMLMALGKLSGQEYALECDKVLKSPDASRDVKMQAMTGLALGMWAAGDAEGSFTSGQQRYEYLSRSHGVMHADLQNKLGKIASGKGGETDPDLRAYAAAMLHAVNRGDQAERAMHLDAAIKGWNNNRGKEGEFASTFVRELKKDLTPEIRPDASQSDFDAARCRQLLAAATCFTMRDGTAGPILNSSGPTQQQVLRALTECVNPSNPQMAAGAIQMLVAEGKGRLPDAMSVDDSSRVRGNAISILNLTNADSSAKSAMVQMMPALLAGARGEGHYDATVSALVSLVKPSPDNENYAGAYPGLRKAAVTALGDLQSKEPQTLETLKYVLSFDRLGQPQEPSTEVRQAALQSLGKVGLKTEEYKQVVEHYLKGERDPGLHEAARARLAERVMRTDPPQGQEFDAGSHRDLVRSREDLSREFRDKKSEDWFRTNFADLLHDRYTKRVQDALPGYIAQQPGFWDKMKYGYDAWRWQDDPEKVVGRTVERYSREYIDRFDTLKRWANGDFKPSEQQTGNLKQGREDAMRALAYLVANDGKSTAGSPLMRDMDRREFAVEAAKSLAEMCRPGATGGAEARKQAAEYVTGLLTNPDISPKARYALIQGLERLYFPPQTAILSKDEAARVVAMSLEAHRQGTGQGYKPPEERTRPSEQDCPDRKSYERAVREHDKDVDFSRMLQTKMASQLVYLHQDRQDGMPLLAKYSREASDPKMKETFEKYKLRLAGGVELSFQQLSQRSNLDTTTHPDARARQMQQALEDLSRNPASIEASRRAVEAILTGTLGRNFDGNDDPRTAVLKQALKSEDERARLAAAYALLPPNGKAGGHDLGRLVMDTLHDLSFNAQNPAIRREAETKVRDVNREIDNRLVRLGSELRDHKSTQQYVDALESQKRDGVPLSQKEQQDLQRLHAKDRERVEKIQTLERSLESWTRYKEAFEQSEGSMRSSKQGSAPRVENGSATSRNAQGNPAEREAALRDRYKQLSENSSAGKQQKIAAYFELFNHLNANGQHEEALNLALERARQDAAKGETDAAVSTLKHGMMSMDEANKPILMARALSAALDLLERDKRNGKWSPILADYFVEKLTPFANNALDNQRTALQDRVTRLAN